MVGGEKRASSMAFSTPREVRAGSPVGKSKGKLAPKENAGERNRRLRAFSLFSSFCAASSSSFAAASMLSESIFIEVREPIIAISSVSARDRKSTRLNSSHVAISYAVFCLKKKKAQ